MSTRHKGQEPEPQELQVGDKAPLITFCVASRGWNCEQFTRSFAAAYAYAALNFVGQGKAVVSHQWCQGTYIDSARNDLAENALKAGADYLIFLDDDMEFPNNVAHYLLKHHLPVVAANYPTRKMPPEPVALTVEDDGTRYWPERDATGLTKVGAVGFGCVLVRADVFAALPYPYFHKRWDEGKNWWVGEDVDFCRKVREAGFDIYVDNDLSEQVKHWGQQEYTLEYARIWRERAGEPKPPPKLELVKT